VNVSASHPLSSNHISYTYLLHLYLHSFPTRRSSDLFVILLGLVLITGGKSYYPAGWYPLLLGAGAVPASDWLGRANRTVRRTVRSEEHTSELQSLAYLVCRLLLEKKNKIARLMVHDY